MGLFSFLFGGKKKEAAKAAAKASAKPSGPGKATSMEKQLASVAGRVPAPVMAPGIVQARLRLKLVTALRTGEQAAAFEAAQKLADIQVKAGRKTAARVWSEQAERIRASMSA